MSPPSLLHSSIGKYRLVEFLGAGGMGEVYRAIDGRTGRTVAVKILSREALGPTALQRFYHEAHVQAGLRHPNVAQLFEFLDHGGRPCLVMELVEGETLADRIRREGRLEAAHAVALFTAVVSAVAYVHAQGIIHRDLKPGNVRIDRAGEVKLLDFGIAKNIGAVRGLTVTGTVIGTPLYLSPEQLRGGEATPRSDIWSLGVLLHEMLAGQVPFEGQTITDLWERISAGRYLRVATLPPRGQDDPRVLRRLDQVIARCLRKDPAERYASAAELLAAVERPRAPTSRRSALRAADTPAPAAFPDVAAPRPTRGVRAFLERSWWWLGGIAAFVVAVLLVWPGQTPDVPGPGGAAGRARPNQEAGTSLMTTVEIDVVQGHADVLIDGHRVGVTPYRLTAPFGTSVDLELRQDGYQALRTKVEVTHQRAIALRMERRDAQEERP